ncbi:hypothetical protein [Dongia deserti]|uniref:hypothetical protein n=1 Tax=Dongia deserti TaxID=2268030 RepID=UPI0013C46EA6|nr:hypothetical protein [Dongia deserti]
MRRRIQRVSGVTIRDERVESRDFSVPSWREDWDDLAADRTPRRREHGAPERDMPSFKTQGIGYRQRT